MSDQAPTIAEDPAGLGKPIVTLPSDGWICAKHSAEYRRAGISPTKAALVLWDFVAAEERFARRAGYDPDTGQLADIAGVNIALRELGCFVCFLPVAKRWEAKEHALHPNKFAERMSARRAGHFARELQATATPFDPDDRTFPGLIVLSQEEAEKHAPDGPSVCISITSPGAAPAKLSAGFAAVLRLEFHDLGNIHPVPAGGVQLSEADADTIVRFLTQFRHAKWLVVHCQAGISRSVAVAQALAWCFERRWWAPRWHRLEWENARHVHNVEVFDRVCAAYVRAGGTVLPRLACEDGLG